MTEYWRLSIASGPLHLSIVGGDPLVRYRELETMIPLLLDQAHSRAGGDQRLPADRGGVGRRCLIMNIVVSIDGLQPEHDVRRAPATYDRILKNIADQNDHHPLHGHRPDDEAAGLFARVSGVLDPRAEIRKVWFSLFTPQVGDQSPRDAATAGASSRPLRTCWHCGTNFPSSTWPEGMIRQFATPPHSPEDCVFALTTQTHSADLETKIVPCQFGGNPDCGYCGCIASMGLAAIAAHWWGGVIPVGAIFKASIKLGQARARRAAPPPAAEQPLRVLSSALS